MSNSSDNNLKQPPSWGELLYIILMMVLVLLAFSIAFGIAFSIKTQYFWILVEEWQTSLKSIFDAVDANHDGIYTISDFVISLKDFAFSTFYFPGHTIKGIILDNTDWKEFLELKTELFDGFSLISSIVFWVVFFIIEEIT